MRITPGQKICMELQQNSNKDRRLENNNDEDDKVFYELYKNEDVDFLITGNKKDTFDQDGPLP